MNFPFPNPFSGENQVGIPLSKSHPSVPLHNLSILHRRIDSLRQFISDSLQSNAPIHDHHIHLVSKEISYSVHQIILNGATLVASSQDHCIPPDIGDAPPIAQDPGLEALVLPGSSRIPDDDDFRIGDPKPPIRLEISAEKAIAEKPIVSGDGKEWSPLTDKKEGVTVDCDGDADAEIVEIDSVELLAEHIHFCDICGKGFKRDANLRMHKRAHGNRFKTLEALSKPDRCVGGRKVRFSCPYPGCNRNKSHKRFRPLKSAVCVKNHFKRSHCPKLYSCNRCNKKSFSVVSDLKSHLKHCGESRWRCSCGTSFSRKDKLFGHVALFEGHMPAIVGEDKTNLAVGFHDRDNKQIEIHSLGGVVDNKSGVSERELFDGFLDGFDAISGVSLDDLMGIF